MWVGPRVKADHQMADKGQWAPLWWQKSLVKTPCPASKQDQGAVQATCWALP